MFWYIWMKRLALISRVELWNSNQWQKGLHLNHGKQSLIGYFEICKYIQETIQNNLYHQCDFGSCIWVTIPLLTPIACHSSSMNFTVRMPYSHRSGPNLTGFYSLVLSKTVKLVTENPYKTFHNDMYNVYIRIKFYWTNVLEFHEPDASVNVMPLSGEDGETAEVLTENKIVRIPTMVQGWMSESFKFPMVHTHVYKLLCQNYLGSIWCNKSLSESQRYRYVFHQNSQDCPPPHWASHWLLHLNCWETCICMRTRTNFTELTMANIS